MHGLFEMVWSCVTQLPLWVVVLLLCILPNFPIPSTALTFAAGTLLSHKAGIGVAVGCVIFAYFIAFSWIFLIGKTIPSINTAKILSRFPAITIQPQTHPWESAFVIRNVPGVPLCLQTYLLICLPIPYLPYLTASILPQLIYVPLLVIGGQAALTILTNPLLGLSILLGIMGILILLNKLKQRKTNQTSQ